MKDSLKHRMTVLALATGLLAACGGGGAEESGAAGASQDAPAGVAEAQEFVEQYLSSPTSLNLTEPLSRKPDAGKTIIAISNGSESNNVLDAALKEAAEALGWEFRALIAGATPEEQQSAFSSAIQLQPDGISLSGIPRTTITAGLQQAEAAGIPVSINASADEPGGAIFDTSISGVPQLHDWGKMIAAYVTTESQGDAKIAVFDLPVFPILHEFVVSFQDNIATWCPDCEVTEVHQQAADIGTKTPGSVVSTLQRSPDTDWVIFDLGDLSTGLEAALRGAGMSDSVNVGGLTATKANLEAVANGTQDAWTVSPLPIVGWRVIDSFARKFNGDSLEPVTEARLPTQLVTPENVDDLVVDENGNYVGVADYREQFKELWQVG